jgi:hypothetical protein
LLALFACADQGRGTTARRDIHGSAVIALSFALATLCAAMTAGFIACLAFYRGSVRELGNARDQLDAKDIVIATVTDERNRAVVAHRVADDQLSIERNLRAIAEAQRNEAQKRVRAELTKHLRTATDDDIRALTAELFASPLGLLPKPEVPKRSESGPDALLDPFA